MHNWGGQIDDKLIHQNTENSFSSVCYFPFSQCFIQLDGSIRICCLDVNGKEIFGDIKKSSIKEIWNNSDFETLRKNLLSGNKDKLPEICKECTYPQKGQWTLPFFWQQGF
jgi:radical SAM protein with 4Fe4S-binding SPASM domain